MFVSFRGASQPLIIHFDNIEGITRIGDIGDLLNIAGIGALIVLVNFAILYSLKSRDHFLANLFSVTTLFFVLLLFIGLAAIINAN